jgi:hypothetical protein
MKRTVVSGAAILLILWVASGFGGRAAVSPKENLTKKNQYVLKVHGPVGAKLDMLLITKPTERGIPTRETATVVVPYSKSFEATSCFAWFDTLPESASGKARDKYEIHLMVNGHLSSRTEFAIEPKNKQTSGLGDL